MKIIKDKYAPWEKKFWEEFSLEDMMIEDLNRSIAFNGDEYTIKLKAFITNLLSSQREELIQKLEKQRPGYYIWFRRYGQIPEDCKKDPIKLGDWIENFISMSYSRAIDKVISLIKEGKE